MKNKDILKIISLALASISFIICLLLWGETSGFRQGYGAAIDIESINQISANFSAHGPNFFEFLIRRYCIIALSIYVYIIGRVTKIEILSHIICVSSLGMVIYQYWQMLQYKKDVLDNSSHLLPYKTWLLNSVWLDWFCSFIVALLLIVQVIILFSQFLRRNNRGNLKI